MKFIIFKSVGLNYIDYLLFKKKFKEAADWCTRILNDCKNWEEKILIFAKEGQLEVENQNRLNINE
jgi:hypothetical protein